MRFRIPCIVVYVCMYGYASMNGRWNEVNCPDNYPYIYANLSLSLSLNTCMCVFMYVRMYVSMHANIIIIINTYLLAWWPGRWDQPWTAHRYICKTGNGDRSTLAQRPQHSFEIGICPAGSPCTQVCTHTTHTTISMPQVVIPGETLSLMDTLSRQVTAITHSLALCLCMSRCTHAHVCVRTQNASNQYVHKFNTIDMRLPYSIWHSCLVWTQTCIPVGHACRGVVHHVAPWNFVRACTLAFC